ncbi:MAG: OB-fold nucleic acid binding domain-containing protein [Candidatus Nomurabacteria bacterium]|nr:OB-fold nucleic acid binding domain-containing protein [Candidatus Nomurabacteria bacterium]
MSSLEEIRDTRIKKLELLKEKGINPFVSESKRELSLAQVLESFDDLEKSGEQKWISGRIMSIRGQGAIVFATLYDGSTSFQALIKKDSLDEEKFNLFGEVVDIGDFIEVQGIFFITKRGEKSIEVKDWQMMTKSLLPLPEKWAGLQDTEERFRKRYLEILTDKEVSDRFILRSKVIKEIRKFFDDLGFLEIETPILKNKAGGAMAEPFVTHHNDLDIDMKLRISLEIEHKMLMVGGYPAVYEIGKNFRNEGSDPTHIQEFTMMEWYSAYHTLEENITWTETLLKSLAKDVIGKSIFTVYDKDGNGVEVNFDTVWPRAKFADLLTQYAGIDMQNISLEDLQKDDYPGDLKPLANQNTDGTAKVAQLIIGGAEITNQYSELVDPLKQRELLEAQAKMKSAGDSEAMDLDEDFITAMEYGMPQMTGFGMGIDRLMAIFTEQKNLREVIFFPIMRPKE